MKPAPDLSTRQGQTDHTLQAVYDPMLAEDRRVLARMDNVVDGLFVTIAKSETKSSLAAGTTAPSATQKPLIASALKPDYVAGGTVEPFKECLTGPVYPGRPGFLSGQAAHHHPRAHREAHGNNKSSTRARPSTPTRPRSMRCPNWSASATRASAKRMPSSVNTRRVRP